MSDIFNGISTAISAVLEWVKDLISGVVDIFYTGPTTSGGTGSFTLPGVLLLVAFGLSMVWVAINFIRGLVRRG